MTKSVKIKRVAIGDKLRFEVFKRDKFMCQYCGQKAPDVVLNVDHIKPVADGGNNGLLNLVTSCRGCNSGKSDRLLDDGSIVAKSRLQADQMEERRSQIRMMAEWQVELSQMNPEIDAIDTALMVIAKQHLSDFGKKAMRKRLREFTVPEIIEAMAIAFDQYSEEEAFGKINGIAANLKIRREDPEQALMHKIVNSLAFKFKGPVWKKKDALRVLLSIRDRKLDWLKISREAEAISRSWYDYIEIIST